MFVILRRNEPKKYNKRFDIFIYNSLMNKYDSYTPISSIVSETDNA